MPETTNQVAVYVLQDGKVWARHRGGAEPRWVELASVEVWLKRKVELMRDFEAEVEARVA